MSERTLSEMVERIVQLEQELRNRPTVSVMTAEDFERLNRALIRFDEARDGLAQAQQVVVLAFQAVIRKLDEVRAVYR